ncbi:hybrid sensor histidine kinase/response regulator [Candidatus Halobeggiatoa sp. HSG11]|nr:hybrid sensor histidine kinase/response regulator [Candidatus Halobeggiatoa sp. HSG11]
MQKKSCLLIVDDEDCGRSILEILLQPENYQLEFAINGEDALQKADELLPDLILLDIIMPRMDGFEVCKRLREHPKLAEVPVIMLTAISDRATRLKGINAGADDFITKPFDKLELLARVNTIIRLNRYRRLSTERMRFDWVVEQSDDGYLLLSDGNFIKYANSAARLYLGLLTENIASTKFTEYLEIQNFKQEPTVAWENWPKSNVGDIPRYLVRPETQNSQLLWLQVYILESPFDNFSGQLVRLSDVSEQMNLQQQMWTFQSLVSHKLRAPLNGLISLQLLDQKNIDLSSQKAHSLLNIAKDSAKRLQEQILDILRYLDSSQLLKNDNTFQLSELPILLNKIQADLKLNPLSIHMDNDLVSKSISFSSQGLELILHESFTNSKKFHPNQSPTLEISVTTLDNKTILISISDDGKYMSNQELNKVWTPYYQSEKYFTGEVKGMGLGLSMIAKLVSGSGGSYRLFNRDNTPGVTLELLLPFENCEFPQNTPTIT